MCFSALCRKDMKFCVLAWMHHEKFDRNSMVEIYASVFKVEVFSKKFGDFWLAVTADQPIRSLQNSKKFAKNSNHNMI